MVFDSEGSRIERKHQSTQAISVWYAGRVMETLVMFAQDGNEPLQVESQNVTREVAFNEECRRFKKNQGHDVARSDQHRCEPTRGRTTNRGI